MRKGKRHRMSQEDSLHYANREAAPQVTAEDVRRAAQIVHIRAVIKTIRHYEGIGARIPGSKAHGVIRYLTRLAEDIPDYYHTYEERDEWNTRNSE